MNTASPVCLITGAAGFLGDYVARAFYAAGYRLFGVDIHPPSQPAIWDSYWQGTCETVDYAQFLDDRKIDVVCHLAGGSSVPASVANPFGDFMSVLPGTARLLGWISGLIDKPHFILFSSAAVYGDTGSLPITESCPSAPMSPYGVHKAVAETLLLHYARNYQIPSSTLRIFSAYGPGLRKQLIWDLAQKALAALDEGKTVVQLFGTGNETRDFVHANDIASAALALATSGSSTDFKIYNVGTGVDTPIAVVAETVLALIDESLSFSFSGIQRTGDPSRWKSDATHLQSHGWRPKTPLTEGLTQTVRWIEQQLRDTGTA